MALDSSRLERVGEKAVEAGTYFRFEDDPFKLSAVHSIICKIFCTRCDKNALHFPLAGTLLIEINCTSKEKRMTGSLALV